MDREGFEMLFLVILERIRIISDESIAPYKPQASEIVKYIDPDDALFFACALAHPGSAIWSDDKRLKEQEAVKVLNTKEMLSCESSRLGSPL